MEDKDFLDESIKPIQCSALRKGGYMLMQKKHPCKVIDITTSKPGKHGSAKVSKPVDHVLLFLINVANVTVSYSCRL